MLLNISRREDNQKMKLYQFIEYKMRNNFLENPAQNLVEELVLYPFLKIKIEDISGSTA